MSATVMDSRASAVLASAVERARGSVVAVRMNGASNIADQGTGVVWRSSLGEGTLVVTNAHVVRMQRGERSLIVRDTDAGEHVAELMAIDIRRDLALLVTHDIAASMTPAIPSSAILRVGQVVIALGHPMGVRNAPTAGVIHALGSLQSEPSIPAPQRGLDWIQVDVRLAPGNSGGPLIDASGMLLGINTMIVGGLALAVPVRAVERFVSANTLRVRHL